MAKSISQTAVLIFFVQILYAQNFDINSLKTIHTNRNTQWDGGMTSVSSIAPIIYATTPLVLYSVGIAKRDKKMQVAAIQQTIGLAVTTISTYALKRLVDRPRPGATYPQYINPVTPLYERSFPSGHSSSSFWWATSMSMYSKKWYIQVPAWSIAATVSYSRMHMGVHYPSDIAAGALLGCGSALISKKINELLQTSRRSKKVYNKLIW
jgi:membrane-associated phospholipid phosphatase